jgi:hypothetical protein
MANKKRLEAKLRNKRYNGAAGIGLSIMETARGLAGFGGRGAPLITEAYNLSWDMAWTMDQMIRLTTYKMQKDNGMTSREAGDLAARVHADYADVPAKLRRTLNKILFTPTYFLSMAKVQTAMLVESAKFAMKIPTLGYFPKQSRVGNELALGAITSTAALWAINSLMESAGYEEDEWGRKWVKEVGDTGEEITVNMTNPLNKNIKYLYWLTAAMDPGELNPAAAVWNRAKWEATPIYRIGLQIVQNRQPNGKPVYEPLDDWKRNLMDITRFTVREVVGMLNYYDTVKNIIKGEPTLFEGTNPETRRALSNDVGNILTGLEALGLAFIGHRSNKERRVAGKMRGLTNHLRKSIIRNYIDTPPEDYTEEDADRWTEEYEERMDILDKQLYE